MSQEKCSLIPLRAALVLFALTACSAGEQSAAKGGEPQNTSTPETPAQAPAAREPRADTAPATQPDTPADAWTAGVITRTHEIAEAATLRDVRMASHGEFDRIVFTFDDAGIPSYHIEYIDRPVRSCGSGEVVELPGEAWLAIRFTPANAHDEQGRPTLPARTFAPRLPNLLELTSICDFEAVVEWVGAVRTPGRYRVLELRAPNRLAVDIRNR